MNEACHLVVTKLITNEWNYDLHRCICNLPVQSYVPLGSFLVQNLEAKQL